MINKTQFENLTKAVENNQSNHHPYLEGNRLKIHGNIESPISAKQMIELLKAFENNTNIQSLDLAYFKMDEDVVKELQKLLTTNHTIKNLKLSDCNIDKNKITKIAESLARNDTIVNLSLNYSITSDAGNILLDGLSKNDTIKVLDLKNNLLDTDNIQKLAEFVQSSKSLTEIYLAGNKFHESIAQDMPLELVSAFLGKKHLIKNDLDITSSLKNQVYKQENSSATAQNEREDESVFYKFETTENPQTYKVVFKALFEAGIIKITDKNNNNRVTYRLEINEQTLKAFENSGLSSVYHSHIKDTMEQLKASPRKIEEVLEAVIPSSKIHGGTAQSLNQNNDLQK